ncbi:MAG TPA: hypothetical protein VEN81_13585 [Planctomycetota bacterium]|nr:hypothetical protein [Planctomycetota bacterium]
MTDDEFLVAFERCALSHDEQWTHAAHLRMAYCHLKKFPFEEALSRVRSGIPRLNAKFGTPELLERGYHDTLTVAWMRLIHATMRAHGALADAETFFKAHPHLTHSSVIGLFYSDGRLWSWEAKKGFVEPDLLGLPPP